MGDMLKASGLRLEGHHHSGLDDCRNIAQCVRYLLTKGLGSHLTNTWRAHK
jgi:inhibitor of KinA sporulation pathway (predicted exonuclease)